jgi:hypothetical protein
VRLKLPPWRGFQCLVIECTYVGEDVSTALATERGHIHLADLATHALRIEAERVCLMVRPFLLTHAARPHIP